MRAFQTALRPSRILNILTVSLHSASLAVCLTWFYGRMMWFGLAALAALAASYAYSLRITNLKHRHAITAITIDRDGQAEIVSGKEKTAKAAALSGSSMVTPYALFLQWDTGGKTVRQCIIPDMTDKESYRKLKVWVLWRQLKKTAETDTSD
ncbi:putative transcriptional regulator FolI [Neisseria meningitidis]|nr:putative transcriptional regulator FolI [Neisseria meningitidis]